MRTIRVVDYDPAWPEWFEQLHAFIWPAVQPFALAIEHVGSTSVPGLAAKPVIDVDVIVPDEAAIAATIAGLEGLGYQHVGDRGITGREAFDVPVEAGLPAHHLYVCAKDALPLRNHLILRDRLRTHPHLVGEYAALKRSLAEQFPHDIDAYVEGKTAFITGILADSGFAGQDIDKIVHVNRADTAR